MRASAALARLCAFAALMLSVPAALPGQASAGASAGPVLSRLDLYGGYGYFRPFSSDIGSAAYEPINAGGVASAAAYFTRHFGVQVEGNFFPAGDTDNNCVYTAQAGPIARLARGRFVPFVHALGGGAKVGGPRQQPCSAWGWGVTGGGGLDYVLPALNDHLAVRPIQADFLYSRVDNGPFVAPGLQGGLGEIYALRLSAGLTLRFGHNGEGLLARHDESTGMTCSADPAQVFAGDPVTVAASTLHLRGDKASRYVWSASGGRVTGSGDQAQVDTGGLVPGTYTVNGRLLEGDHDRETASCMASFRVEAPPPPTIACSADRAAIHSGDPVTISTRAISPTGRPLTLSYTASGGGTVSGTGDKVMLATSGATPGTLTVTCTATDGRGGTASSTASVVVATPEKAAPAPEARGLCTLSFERDRRRPQRVDNEAKACLDDIALTLNREPGARLLLLGHAGPGESAAIAAARVLNASDYLAAEKGIDTGRLELRTAPRTGSAARRTVETMLLPEGTAAIGEAFNRAGVKRTGEPYGRGRTAAPRSTRRAGRHTRARRRRMGH